MGWFGGGAGIEFDVGAVFRGDEMFEGGGVGVGAEGEGEDVELGGETAAAGEGEDCCYN